MEGKDEVKAMVSSQQPPDIQLTNVDVKQYSSPDDLETFYVKLTDLLDSSGFTLILNVRETRLDLYQFYLEVTKRGGYHQIGKEKKWGFLLLKLQLPPPKVHLKGSRAQTSQSAMSSAQDLPSQTVNLMSSLIKLIA